MSLPGEKAAYHTLYSSLSSANAKAEASVRLAEIAEIKRRDAEGEREYRERQALLRGRCPTCGR